MPTYRPATSPAAYCAERYSYRRDLSEVLRPQISVNVSMTAFASCQQSLVQYPAVLGAARTLTLGNRCKSAGAGAAMPPLPDAVVTVQRGAVTADASSLTVANHNGAMLATMSAAGTTQRFCFDGVDWLLVS